MRHNRYIIVLIAVFYLSLIACNKFLDVEPKGFTLLKTVSDYDQWLNDDIGALETVPQDLNILADNVDKPSVSVPPGGKDLVYSWALQFSSDLNTAPNFWGQHYANINKYNTVINGIDKATDGSELQKKSLNAEALLGRAFEYWYLINEYGKVYDPATAAQDPGVPFITSNDVTQVVPPRASVQEVYDHIISDINTAIPGLPQNNSKNRFRGSLSAAYSVLARVYLYQRDYPNAAKNAKFAIQNGTARMVDFRLPLPSSGVLNGKEDVIYGRQNVYAVLLQYQPTLDLLHLYAVNDLRLNLFYTSMDNFTARGGTNVNTVVPYVSYTNFGTSVQEMKLIIAESAARIGDAQNLQAALQQLNELRIDRFLSSAYQPLQSNDKDQILNWVLRERSIELPFSGLRWFDMRRLDKEGQMQTVMRYDAQNNIIATLPHNSPKYTLQIPVQVLQFHPDMMQNPQ